MGDSRSVAGFDRLPWLADEPKPQPRRGKRDWVAWGTAGALIVAGLALWIPSAIPTWEQPEQKTSAPTTVSVPLPEPRSVEPSPVQPLPPREIAPAPLEDVRPAPVRDVRIPPSPPPRVSSKREAMPNRRAIREQAPNIENVATPTAAAAPSTQLELWSPRTVWGAAGRLVQIGAFGSRLQAKQGWWAMARAYPAMQRLPALVVETRNSHGRAFYRFQVGTTSQAHSEVLCQRMQKIRLSCAVVGLPWKAKVER